MNLEFLATNLYSCRKVSSSPSVSCSTELILTGHASQKRLINSADFHWKHFAAGPILPMVQYISVVKSNDFNISNNNFNLPTVTKFALFPTDVDTVRVNN